MFLAVHASPADDTKLVDRLRDGDENAFSSLIDAHQTSMLRIALIYVQDRETAEDVVQETWVAMLRGLDRFEGRSSLKTWIFSILANLAKTRAQRDGRSISFSMVEDEAPDSDEPTVDPARFTNPAYPGHWAAFPDDWEAVPEARLLSQETLDIIRQAIQGLKPNQREVIQLRDVEGCSSEEVCNILGISDTNQRVLLHRARAAVRNVLEQYLGRNN